MPPTLRALPADPHHLLLVNPLTILDPQAIPHLLDCAARVARYHPTPTILVGATRCPTTGDLATSGLNRKSPNARTYDRVQPTLTPLPIDTFDPNCLLIPTHLLPTFHTRPLTHAIAHHLRRQGYSFFLAPHYVGTCPPAPRRSKAQSPPGFPSPV